jgi:hypothetical protein
MTITQQASDIERVALVKEDLIKSLYERKAIVYGQEPELDEKQLKRKVKKQKDILKLLGQQNIYVVNISIHASRGSTIKINYKDLGLTTDQIRTLEQNKVTPGSVTVFAHLKQAKYELNKIRKRIMSKCQYIDGLHLIGERDLFMVDNGIKELLAELESQKTIIKENYNNAWLGYLNKMSSILEGMGLDSEQFASALNRYAMAFPTYKEVVSKLDVSVHKPYMIPSFAENAKDEMFGELQEAVEYGKKMIFDELSNQLNVLEDELETGKIRYASKDRFNRMVKRIEVNLQAIANCGDSLSAEITNHLEGMGELMTARGYDKDELQSELKARLAVIREDFDQEFKIYGSHQGFNFAQISNLKL